MVQIVDGKELAALRKELGIRAFELEDATGLSRGHIANLEINRRTWTRQHAKKYVKGLHKILNSRISALRENETYLRFI